MTGIVVTGVGAAAMGAGASLWLTATPEVSGYHPGPLRDSPDVSAINTGKAFIGVGGALTVAGAALWYAASRGGNARQTDVGSAGVELALGSLRGTF